ncbi:hypothetical protein [Planctopirus hydrillae]|uniref:hypothetical protein n=1 Tax=Planctopirus hydrillae TaxID=1841610 RepID=UPI0010420CF7|nr:hypothetical protein [Planctopirus hydrillae]
MSKRHAPLVIQALVNRVGTSGVIKTPGLMAKLSSTIPFPTSPNSLPFPVISAAEPVFFERRGVVSIGELPVTSPHRFCSSAGSVLGQTWSWMASKSVVFTWPSANFATCTGEVA